MVVVLEAGAGKRWRGLSTDEKPRFADESDGPIPAGATFTEIDTGHRYYWDGSWRRQVQTIESALMEMNDLLRDILAVVTATHKGHEAHLWDESVETDTF